MRRKSRHDFFGFISRSETHMFLTWPVLARSLNIKRISCHRTPSVCACEMCPLAWHIHTSDTGYVHSLAMGFVDVTAVDLRWRRQRVRIGKGGWGSVGVLFNFVVRLWDVSVCVDFVVTRTVGFLNLRARSGWFCRKQNRIDWLIEWLIDRMIDRLKTGPYSSPQVENSCLPPPCYLGWCHGRTDRNSATKMT